MQGYSKYESHELKKQTNKIDIEDEICGFCIRLPNMKKDKFKTLKAKIASFKKVIFLTIKDL